MTIHKEGKVSLILVVLFCAVIGFITYAYASPPITYFCYILLAALFLLILQFFRKPELSIDINDHAIIAPADGKVVVIEDTEEKEYLMEKRKQVSIFMSPINVHINRNPVSGIIKYFKYHPGKYLVAWHPKSSTENERTTLVYETKGGVQILVRQIAGALARRIKWYVDNDSTVTQGEEFGFIKFGSRVDLFLPLDAEICVELEQKTKGGKTIIAKI